MSKLNPTKKNTGKTVNKEGFGAYKLDKKTELYTRVATCLWEEPKFYGEFGETEAAIISLVDQLMPNDGDFVLKLAAYARNELHLRTIPIVLLAEVLGHESLKNKPKTLAVEYGPFIVLRADEMANLVAYYSERFGRPFPDALKRIVRNRLNALTEYEALKYSGKSKKWSIRDLLRMFRPKPADCSKDALFRYIVSGELSDSLPIAIGRKTLMGKGSWDAECQGIVADGGQTWETVISKFGNKPEVWDALSLPFMAMLRNLRNMIECGADVDKYIKMLTSEKSVLNSKQFPYRFLSAYKAIIDINGTQAARIIAAIKKSADISIANVPFIEGRNLIAVDASGSMTQPVSKNSKITMMEIGFSLGAIMYMKSGNSDVYAFAGRCKKIDMSACESIIPFINECAMSNVGYATNAHLPVYDAIRNNEIYDRIIIFSDMQVWDTEAHQKSVLSRQMPLNEAINEYRKHINADVKIIVVDIAGYGTSAVNTNDKNVLVLSGWSDRIFELINTWEQSDGDAISAISNYKKENNNGQE